MGSWVVPLSIWKSAADFISGGSDRIRAPQMRIALRPRGFAVPAVLTGLVLALSIPLRGGPTEVRSGDRLAYALTGARVTAAPGRVIENGGVVGRGGGIEAVGPHGKT